MQLETIIALIAGAVTASVLAFVLYKNRDRISALQRSAQQTVTTTREKLSRNAESVYRDAVIKMANGMHLAGHLAPLEQIAVEPRFYTRPHPFDPLVEEDTSYESPLTLIPIVPDWPQMLAPYHLPSIPLQTLLKGDKSLVLLGHPGSGRTTTLALIAMLAAQQKDKNSRDGLLDQPRLPIYFDCTDLVFDPEEYEETVDPLQPLIRAARAKLRGVAGRLLGAVSGEFAAGNGLLLVDGWDELSDQARSEAIEWLTVLLDMYPGNRLVFSGPVLGFGPLTDLGCTPVYIHPWHDREFAILGQRWAAAWPVIGGAPRNPAPPVPDDLVRRVVRGNRARTPLDATLRIWAAFAQDDPGTGHIGWYQAYVTRVTLAPGLNGALARMADLSLTRPEEPGLNVDEVTNIIEAEQDTLTERIPVSTGEFITTITNTTHLLTSHPNKRLTFTHPVIAGYLAAEALKDAPHQVSLGKNSRISRLVMPFLAQLRDVGPYVEDRLDEPDTVLSNRLLEIAAWAVDADTQAPWRTLFFKRMAALLLGPSEFPSRRARVTAALVASRDPSVVFIFREGLRSSDPTIRMLSALGLGASGDAAMAGALGETWQDRDPKVEIATGLALGALNAKTAISDMVKILMNGSDPARRGVAEMMGVTNTAGEGHDMLREAAGENDPAIRRATVYGLERIGEPWAIDMVDDIEKHDQQWLVRAAASGVMERHRAAIEDPPKGPRHIPLPEDTDWLAEWLEGRGDVPSPGSRGISQLVRALQEGDEATRLAAVEAIGALGIVQASKSLYEALRDEHPEIRDAAYKALGCVSLTAGREFPSVMV